MSTLDRALDALVPPFDAEEADWAEIVRRGGRRRRFTGRRIALAAAVLALVATLVATPALGLQGLLLGLFGRTDVPFVGEAAPIEVKREFYDLGLGAPPGMSPDAIASQTRRVATFRVDGKTSVLWVAPTRAGGYCWQFSGRSGGCHRSRDEGTTTPRRERGSVNPALLGATFQASSGDVQHVTWIGGDIRAPSAHSLSIEYADGGKTDVPFYYVGRPIDAGFFLRAVPPGHQTEQTRATALVLRDRTGKVLARQPFIYQTADQRQERERRLREFMKSARLKPPRPSRQKLPPVPPPSLPLQRGSAEGVTVVAGSNGVVAFDTSEANRETRALIAGRAGYGCFRRQPFHAEPVNLTHAVWTVDRVAIRIQGLRPPFMGCDIQGGYGHRWPDRLGGHSAVEVAFTPAGRRFFHDRATARDLSLFVRSRDVQRIRKLEGEALATAIWGRYGDAITRLDSPSAPLPPGRIGYATAGNVTTFVERSPTGRSFRVRVADGRIAAQNMNELSLVF
jgi:hypothetical protein